MKIALLDLNHTTRGVHTNTAPLGIGLIARYLHKEIGSGLDIKMFKGPDKVSAILNSWVPDVVGISQYSWNSELNLYFAELIKKINSNCLVIVGGPNLDYSESGRIKYFKDYSFVDICVTYDGEIPFAEIIKRLLAGEDKASLLKRPVAGSYSSDFASGKIIVAAGAPPRLTTLNVFGSIYADGFFDEFLDQGFHPFLQTHRGCPFACAFCHTSDPYYSRMLFLSPEIFDKEMAYLGRRFAGRHDITLYLANTNMSLFPEDFAIAEIIKKTKEKYDWPKIINVNSGKDPKKLLEMKAIIDYQPGIALQTLTPEVLENIGRKNIAFADFMAFQQAILKKPGQTSATELILCLPGETKESFVATLKKVINSGVQDICVYTLMNLRGTLLSSEEYAERFGYIIRHRIVPRQFSQIGGKIILDTEEVIVGTNTMSYEDYFELCGLCFIIAVFFGSMELAPLKKMLLEYKIDLARWVFDIHKSLVDFIDLESCYKSFIEETTDELFPSREALLEYFNQPENFQALRSGKLGDNLLRKYKYSVIADHFTSFLKLALARAERLLDEKLGEKKAGEMLSDLAKYLASRNVKGIFESTAFINNKKIHLNYDIPSWLAASENQSLLENFIGSFDYLINFAENVRKKANDFVKANKDHDLSLQILYRDGNIKEFWPSWQVVEG